MRLPKSLACALSLLASISAAWAQVVINEIHYQPVEKEHFSTTGVPTFSDTNLPADFSDDVHEFLELQNAGASAVDLSGWTFSSGIEYAFPAGTTIPAGGFLVIAKNPGRIATVYGLTPATVLGPFLNGSKLSNSGDTVTLTDGSGNVVDSVSYSSSFPWAISAAGLGASDDFTGLNSSAYQYKGRSLQRVSATASSNDPANWVAVRPAVGGATFADLPTPGSANIVTRAVPKPVVTAYSALQATDNAVVIRPTVPVKVTCTFSNTDSLSNVQVEYFLDNLNAFGEARSTVAMTAIGNGQYTATLPGQIAKTILRYRIIADRGDGSEVVSPRADDPAVVPVGPPTYLASPAPPNAPAKIAGAREPWYAYFVTPVRSSPKPIIDLMVSTDGSLVDDIATDNTVQFNGLNGFQAMAFDCKGSPKRTTAENTPSSYPRETPYVRASDRIWEDTVPAVFATNGVIRDIQIRFHRSRYNRNPSSKSFKVFFPDYSPYVDVAGTVVTSIFETNHDDTTLTAHGLHTFAGLPVTPLRYVDWYFNNDSVLTRLEQGEYEGEFLKSYFAKLHRLNPAIPTESPGEYYKSSGFIVGSNLSGEGPYGSGNEWKLPAAGFWTEFQRFSYTYGLQNHLWIGAAPVRDLVNGMWTARGDTYTSPNPNIINTKAWFNANWDVDTELTALSVGNWMCPWDDTTQNHFLYHRSNGKWFRILWDFDGMYGNGDSTSSSSSLYLGEVGNPNNNSRGPNYVKDSFIKSFRAELNQRFWFMNNTLFDPENLMTLTYTTSAGSSQTFYSFIQAQGGGFALNRFNFVNTSVNLGVFYKPVRPAAISPANAAAVLPGASLVSSAYVYNATLSHAAAPTVSPHASSKWEIRLATSTYDYPVYIATSTTNKTSLPIPFDQLVFGQTYYWRVTYYAADGHPSITSAERSFSYGPTSTLAGPISLNEIMAENRSAVLNADAYPDYIELKNNSAAPIDITGWGLSDDDFNLIKYVFPGGTSVPAGGYLVVWCDSRTTAPGLHTGFGLDRDGQRVLLTQNGVLKDVVTFGPQAANFSIGRIVDGTGSWALTQPTPNSANIAAALGAVSALSVNEWMASPSNAEDWFELYNSGASPVALGGLYLSGTPGTPKNTQIPPLSFIAENGFTKFVADGTTQGFNHVNFKLSAGGDNVVLTNTNGVTAVASVTFGPQAKNVSQGRLPDGAGSIVSFPGSATPGASNYALAAVLINEALTNSTAPFEDAIELYNPSANPVDISGWWLSDDLTRLLKYQIPAGVVIPAGGYQVFYENQFNPTPGSGTSFSLSSLGDDLVLSAVDGNGILTGTRDQVSFGAALENVSFGRIPTAGGGAEFWPLKARTFGQDSPPDPATFRTGLGALNAAPVVGPVIFNEIMYHPPDLTGGIDDTQDEFIEFYNVTTNPVDLSGWVLRGDSDFAFPAGSTIAAKGYLLLVSFDPATDATALAAFRSTYAIDESTLLYGPYTTKLSNSTHRLELARPAVVVPDLTSLVLVDKVVYQDSAPWPTDADGIGSSLQRTRRTAIGNDAANWMAAMPTPGAATVQLVNGSPLAVDDVAHLPFTGGALTLDVRANDSDPDNDALTISSVGDALNGTATTDGATITYTPGANYTGSDQFTYTLSDGYGGSATATVTLSNTPPAALGDSFHPLASAAPYTFDVLANDTDADADSLTITGIATAPAHGSAQVTANTIVYIPDGTFTGSDHFTYMVSDGYGGSATATVTLSNTPPTALGDSFRPLASAAPFTFNVLANDSDGDADVLTVTGIATTPAHGSAEVSGNAIVYNPDGTFTGSDVFSYTISDGHGGQSSATVRLGNTPPVALPDSAISNGEPVTISVLSNDTDLDGDLLSLLSVTNGTAGTAVINGSDVVYTPGVDFDGNDSLTYRVSDGHGGVATGAVTVGATQVRTRSVAVTGTEVPGAPGWFFSGMQPPAIGDDQLLSWLATAKSGSKRKNILLAGNPGSALFGKGDIVPDSAGAWKFGKIFTPVTDSAGRAAFISTFTGKGVTTRTGSAVFAAEPSGTTTRIAQGGQGADGGGTFSKFRSLDAEGGETIYVADLASGMGTGVWAWDGASSRLIVRSKTVAQFTNAGPKYVNAITVLDSVPNSPGHGRGHRAGEVAMRLSFADRTTGVAIAQFDGGAWKLTLLGLSGAPTGADGTWKSFGPLALAKPGSGVTLAALKGPVRTDDTAVVLLDEQSATIVARESDATPIPGTTFSMLSNPVANAKGAVAFTSTMKGAVTRTNAAALFLRDPAGNLTAAARQQDPAPGTNGATWLKFTSFALPSGPDAGPIFLATLNGPGVNAKNNLGLWARASDGSLVLLARTGDPAPVGDHTDLLYKISLLSPLPPAQGSARSYNGAGRVAFLATFKNGTQAIEVVRIP